MKKVLLAMAFMLLASTSFAAPFLVCNPQTGVTSYEITGGITASYIAQPDGSLRYDLGALANGSYDISVAACNVGGCSSEVPFSFTKNIPLPPAGLRVVAK